MYTDGPVVIALDGSTHSAQTLRWGLREASLRRAEVLLARAVRELRDIVNWSWYPLLGEDLGLDTDAKQYLEDQHALASAEFPSWWFAPPSCTAPKSASCCG